MWLMPLMVVAFLMGNVTNTAAQSVKVLNSNPDKGGGGFGCLWGHSNAVSIYVEIPFNRTFNVDLIKVNGLTGQVSSMSMVKLPPNPNGRPGAELWQIDLTLSNNLSYYANSSNNVVFEVTLTHGVSGEGGPTLNQTETFNVTFCLKQTGIQRENLELESPVSIEGISPNPTKDKITLNLSVSMESELSIELVNGIGEKIRTINKSENLAKGEYLKEIDISDLAKGVYYLVISTEYGVQTEKILKL